MSIFNFRSPYKKWKSKVDEILGRTSPLERKIIQQDIYRKLVNNMSKGKDDFFNLDHLMDIPQVKQYFKIIIIEGTRNIGKTYASQKYIEKVVNEGQNFVYARATDRELQSVVPSLKANWFASNSWTVYKNTVKDPLKRVIGNIVDINNIANFKGIQFGNIGVFYWDEFNTNIQIRGDIVHKFSTLLTTAVRHNENVLVLLTANYGDRYNEIMATFGTDLIYDPDDVDKEHQLLVFNWVSGAIIWRVPEGWYKEVDDDKNNPAYRVALSSPIAYSAQYSADYENSVEGNILQPAHVKELRYLFCLSLPEPIKKANRKVSTIRLFFSHATAFNREFIYVSTMLKQDNIDLPIFSTSLSDNVLDIASTYVSKEKFEFLYNLWKEKKLYVDSIQTYETFTKWLALVFGSILNKELITDMDEL
ncbi:MAG: hypothetical protein E7Y34_01215 [Mycoplasma sp.]|nr:hypothetical protein [Mycoplasma sp.]